MIILIHSSKTMRPAVISDATLPAPLLIDKAVELSNYMKTLNMTQLSSAMHLSDKLAKDTYDLVQSWTDGEHQQRASVDSYLGDIYSGLQANNWSEETREYANSSLRILSGLYGILSPNEGIFPYRLEMGYKLPNKKYSNLYDFWGDSVAKTIPKSEPIINLAALEYSKLITKYVDNDRIFSPGFATISPQTGEPTFVVVHAKIARGAFANWLIKERIEDPKQLSGFNELGYEYSESLSEKNEPAFICKEFKGLGLSVRLT